jgi:hypothetical protein
VRSSFAALSLVCVTLVALAAYASDTQWWVSDTAGDHAKGESHGIVVRSDGTIELGPRAISTPDDSLTTIWAILLLKDGSVALAGDRGRIDRWTEKDGARPWVRLPVGQVLSLAADGDGLVAGTGPEGRIYRVSAKGDTSRLCVTGERYVWGLIPEGPGTWIAATGTHGLLLRVRAGKVDRVFDSDESNLVSVVSDGKGGVYAGGDSRGRVIHVPARGSPRTVYDASEDEIRALAMGADGALYAAALSASVVAPVTDEEPTAAPSPSRSLLSDARAIVYRIVPDSIVTVHWTSPQPFVHALLPRGDGLLAATGNRAGVYRLERADGAAMLLAATQGQVTALAARGEQVFAATSNPAALWRLGPEHAAHGELLSGALDARRVARFGRILWRGEANGARVELFGRSGNTDPPDSTWSAWQGGSADAAGRAAGAPPARYFQWKLVLNGGSPRIASVEASWREQNLPPRVEDVTISGQGQDVREGDLTPRVEPITQTLPGGQKVEYSLTPQPNPRQLRELPVWARGLRTVQWRGVDPNGDPLRYRIEARAEGAANGVRLADDVEATTWTIDTHSLPDGRYRIRVTANDRAGNAQGEERSGEGFSAPFTVDNTPPAVTRLEVTAERAGVRVSGTAEDAESSLSRLEVAYDGEDWRAVTPTGGFTDAQRLEFQTRVSDLKPGIHSVGIRAVDAAGNSVTRAALVDVSGR